jgi:heptosyltransferase-2
MSLPAIRAVRGRFPEAELCILARPWVAAVYEGESAIDRILALRGGRLAAIQSIRTEKFDLAIALPNSFDSALTLWGAGIARRIGYARDGRSFLLTDAVRRPEPGSIPKHERYFYLELLRRSGIIDALPEVDEIHLEGREEARARGVKLIGTTRAIGVSPGAAYGTAKRWIPERFAEAASAVAARIGASILIFGSVAEKDLCARVASLCGGRNLAGATTLREFIDMTAACSAYLSNDSGAMHLAAALGVPSVTVFGPTDETATGPVAANASLLRQPVECSPCLKRECPIDHRCMTRVSAEAVATEAIRLVSVQ